MNENVLILIKPDGITKDITGYILTRLVEVKLYIIASKIVRVYRKLAAEHYNHLRGKPFFKEVIQFSLGGFS